MKKMKNDFEIDDEKRNKIIESIDKLKNKKSKFIFCVPEIHTPSALIYEIYFHADVVEKMGFEVLLLTDKSDYNIPDYIEDDLINKKHVSMDKLKLSVGPDDFMIIPEIFSNVMEQTKNLPCKRIVFLQSFDYMLNALIPGSNWRDFGIEDVITTSNMLKECLDLFYGVNFFKTKTYKLGLPDYFHKSEKPQKPVISIVGRNPNDISKIVKLFYAKYPQYRWVVFDAMLTKSKPPKPLRRIDFAEKLRENFAAVWIDRISSFGTFPLECMASGVIPISLKPDITPEYILEEKDGEYSINENSGIWTKDFYDIPFLIGTLLTKFLDDSIPENLYSGMNKISSEHTHKKSKKQIEKIYTDYINERIQLFEKAIKIEK